MIYFSLEQGLEILNHFLPIQQNVLLLKSFDSSEAYKKFEEKRSISNITLLFVRENCRQLAFWMLYTYDPGVCCYCPKERNRLCIDTHNNADFSVKAEKMSNDHIALIRTVSHCINTRVVYFL